MIFGFWLVFLVGFVALSLYDLRWYELPHDIVFWLICLALAEVAVVALLYGGGANYIMRALYGMLVIGGLFGVLYRLSPQKTEPDDANAADTTDSEMPPSQGIGSRILGTLLGGLLGGRSSKWIGGGDVTLGILLGLIVGGPNQGLMLIFLSSLIGTLVALPLIALGRATRSSHMPYGPFLMAAAIIVMLFGTRLIDWYSRQFIV